MTEAGGPGKRAEEGGQRGKEAGQIGGHWKKPYWGWLRGGQATLGSSGYEGGLGRGRKPAGQRDCVDGIGSLRYCVDGIGCLDL